MKKIIAAFSILFFIVLLNDLFAQPSLHDHNEINQTEIGENQSKLIDSDVKEIIRRTFNKRYQDE